MVLEPGEDLDYLHVNATRCTIDVMIKDISLFNYELIAEHAKVEMGPDFRQFPWQVSSTEKMVYYSEDIYRQIEIVTTYNLIKLHENEAPN